MGTGDMGGDGHGGNEGRGMGTWGTQVGHGGHRWDTGDTGGTRSPPWARAPPGVVRGTCESHRVPVPTVGGGGQLWGGVGAAQGFGVPPPAHAGAGLPPGSYSHPAWGCGGQGGAGGEVGGLNHA